MFHNIGPLELGLIFMIVLIIFGPKSLPRVGQALGRGIREFKNAAAGLHKDLEDDEERRLQATTVERETVRETRPAAIEQQAASSTPTGPGNQPS